MTGDHSWGGRGSATPLQVLGSGTDNVDIAILLCSYYIGAMKSQLIRKVDPKVLTRAAEIIKMLGHPERLKIVEVLESGEGTVTDVQEALGLSQPTVSQHLARMRGAGIVASRRDGVNVYYRVVEPKVWHILKCIRACDM